MAEGGEMRGFVFAISFIIIFAGLLAAMPEGFQGVGGTADTLLPINPDLFTDFSATTDELDKTDFTNNFYTYDLGGYSWRLSSAGTQFKLDRKILVIGLLWFGAVEETKFVLDNGTSRGSTLTMSEIDADANEGAVRYDMEYTDSGNTAGGFIVYWNTTAYADPEDAWNNNVLHLVHGMGLDATAAKNIFALILGLLFFQLPDMPILVNLFIATPLWACIGFLLWYVITKSLPFVG